VTLLARTAALVLAVTVGSQALAPAGAVLVCKYTGKVLDPCACPQRKGAQAPAVQAEGCCELRAAPPSSPALARAAVPSPSRPEPFSWAPPPAAPRIEDRRSAFIAARPQAPPGTPRYLSIRTLLI
jgi:hypothetical protein